MTARKPPTPVKLEAVEPKIAPPSPGGYVLQQVAIQTDINGNGIEYMVGTGPNALLNPSIASGAKDKPYARASVAFAMTDPQIDPFNATIEVVGADPNTLVVVNYYVQPE